MKRLFVSSFFLTGIVLQAQSIGNSPYAAYGIGDVKYDNTTDISAMGGISSAYITDLNNKFNFKNPAANANLNLTSFNVEGTNENNFYKSDYKDMKSTKHSTYLSNISLAFPLSQKIKFGLGYQPYSSKTYEILTSSVLQDGTTSEYNRFSGQGSISTVQAALSYNITGSFALGFRTNYYFGKIYDIEELGYNTAPLINGYETENRIKSFNFTAATTFQKKFENDRKLTVGATYTFGNTGNMETRYKNSTYYYGASVSEHLNESIIEERKNQQQNLIPQEASLGIGYGHEAKWFASTQVDYKKGEKIQFLGQPFNYNDSYKISAGGWYLPNYNNFRNYFSRIIYRFGAYYEKGGLNIQPAGASAGSDINKYALTAGVTLPFANTNINRMSSIDLGIELGKKGTLQNNLISQNFVNVRVGLNFADKWFTKRQFD